MMNIHKRLLAAMLCAAMLACPLWADSDDASSADTSEAPDSDAAEVQITLPTIPSDAVLVSSITTSHNESNRIQFSIINGNLLHVRAVLDFEQICYAWLNFIVEDENGRHEIYNDYSYDVKSGVPFTLTLPLEGMPSGFFVRLIIENERLPGRGGSVNGSGSIFVVKDGDGNYAFVESRRLPFNKKALEGWINPAKAFNMTIGALTQKQSDELCEGITDDYKKAFEIYKWVIENIYIDYDYLEGKKNGSLITPDRIIEYGYSDYNGIAKTLESMLEAQGIPAVSTTLGTVPDGGDYFLTNMVHKANHVMVEAYINGRWVMMLPCIDIDSRLTGGEFINYVEMGYPNFDATVEYMSGQNSILYRTTETVLADIPDEWAKKEVGLALANGLVPGVLQTSYRSDISRAEFCRLIMRMIYTRTGAQNGKALLASRGIEYADNFTDTNDEDIITANLLGIVNGRGAGMFDPKSGISRQEAAVMLTNAARVLGIRTGAVSEFRDINDAAAWARDAIIAVTSYISVDGTRVMTGIGNGSFSPLGVYTRQQAILTVYRLFRCE